jgi:hypothetical protein
MNNQDEKIRRMSEPELINHIKAELYAQLDNHRKMNNSTILHQDETSESAIDEYFFAGEMINKEDQINRIMTEVITR